MDKWRVDPDFTVARNLVSSRVEFTEPEQDTEGTDDESFLTNGAGIHSTLLFPIKSLRGWFETGSAMGSSFC